MFLLSRRTGRWVQVALDTDLAALVKHKAAPKSGVSLPAVQCTQLVLLPSLCGRATQLLGSSDQDPISQEFSNEIQEDFDSPKIPKLYPEFF